MSIGTDRRTWLRTQALSRGLAQNTVVLPATGPDHEPVTLNRTGTSLWVALERPRTVSDLAEMVGGDATADISAWLHQMAELDLVHPSDDANPAPVATAAPRPPAEPEPVSALAALARQTNRDRPTLDARLLAAALADATGEGPEVDDSELLGLLGRLLLIERGALRAISALRRADIDVIVLKGLATAHLDHARPEHRSFGDADLLVPERQFVDALAALGEVGYQPTFTLDRTVRTAKAVTLSGPDDVVIDLHQRLVRGTYGFLANTTTAFSEPDVFTLAGHELWALAPAERFVHAALHARLTATAPHTLADLIVLAHRVPLGQRSTTAARWRATTVCRQAMADVETRTGVELPPATAGPGGTFDRWLASGHYGVIRREVTALAVIGGPIEAARYGLAKLAPGPGYRRARGSSQWGHVRQGLSRPNPPSGAR